ncbi:WD40/YVTN/BNR-like repeat-containing protein [Pseudomonas typographi]|uniref:Glycosyl hydrolase n=1 Tax=Pseudomonas typographi TaxID=2715964 RepID=A0ABR7Z1Y3_9PSED|nr:YCF48-related protein [Pseudomonas typographi]MBD1599417.1 glycosyl hydrolase [Pseudomonas typographi]
MNSFPEAKNRGLVRGCCAMLAAWAVSSGALATTAKDANAFQDTLDVPAIAQSKLAERSLIGIARAGDRLVAVGLRGLIMYTDDQGATWKQANVPVQSDLLAVQFADPHQGWAVGHDGVILHSADAGQTWTKQMDGRTAQAQARDYYEPLANGGDEAAAQALGVIDANYRSGPALPYLDVWFSDVAHGYVVGAFGNIMATHDGGKTWESWLLHIDNPDGLHLNSIRGINGRIYIAAEQGNVFRLEPGSQRFERIATGYTGSFFGIAGNARMLLAYGLRGTLYRSQDNGSTWAPVKSPSQATITAGTALPAAGFVLVNSAGQLLLGDDNADSFRMVSLDRYMRLTSVIPLHGSAVALTGLSGVIEQRLPSQ